jgi:hemerythrin-like domain-containing protein
MTDEEIIQYVNSKFKHVKNKIKSVKENFPKEPKEGNKFDEIFYNILEDYAKENLRKKNKKI